ncbi:MAG: polyprenyl synthetase family protein [Elusimicrobia bacterium]|nr:polyprenyl synthetase family protein [Elusimicrobiota bacterium]
MDINKYLARKAAAVDGALPGFINGLETSHPKLKEAMLYSLSAGGKRLRPALLGAAYELYGGNFRDVLPAACALEMVHTYSLIHDDLPAMDDDDLRRGRPTNHKVYGEALAILAGDALLTDAFSVLVSLSGSARRAKKPARGVKKENVLKAVAVLARHAGACGMVSGQAADLEAEGFRSAGKMTPAVRKRGANLLAYIHLHKTADLLMASVEMGAALAGAPDGDLKALSAFARKIGLCFQIADDILDVTGDKKKLGKNGSDRKNKKLTCVSLFGLEAAGHKAEALMCEAKAELRRLSRPPEKVKILSEIAEFVYRRES